MDFPDHPALRQLTAAFERGDFAYVRQNARRVADATDDAAVQRAAMELRKRIDPDPLVVFLLALALGLLAFLAVWVYV